MTDITEDRERAREISPCNCAAGPDAQLGAHSTSCASLNQADIAAALAQAREEGAATLRAHFRRFWRCNVVQSGYHNGASCTEADPHGGPWNCGFRRTAILTDEEWSALANERSTS